MIPGHILGAWSQLAGIEATALFTTRVAAVRLFPIAALIAAAGAWRCLGAVAGNRATAVAAGSTSFIAASIIITAAACLCRYTEYPRMLVCFVEKLQVERRARCWREEQLLQAKCRHCKRCLVGRLATEEKLVRHKAGNRGNPRCGS